MAKSTFPSSTRFHYPILLLLADGKEHTRKEMLVLEIEKLFISVSDQKVTTPKGKNKVDSWLNYAIADLIGAEYIYHIGNGYAITKAGKDFFDQHKLGFEAKELKTSIAYRKYKRIGEFSKHPKTKQPVILETPTANEEGVVYILTNPAFKDFYIKIGYTTNLNDRLKELYNTSVPLRFQVFAVLKTKKYKQAEKMIHLAFKGSRIGDDREFFMKQPQDALDQMKVVAEGLEAIVIQYDEKGKEKKVYDYSK